MYDSAPRAEREWMHGLAAPRDCSIPARELACKLSGTPMRHLGLLALALGLAGACANGETIESDDGNYEFNDDSGVLGGAGGESGAGAAPTGGVATSSGGASTGSGGAATSSGGVSAGSGGAATSGGASTSDGGAESGGASTSSGGAGAGGAPAAGGSGTASGGGATTGDGGGGCPDGQKECSAGCMTPNPGIGCGLTGCTPCPEPPADGYATCVSGACGFDCYLTFKKNAAGDGCEPESGGGTGGSGQGGSTSGGACQNGNGPSGCPACTVVQGQKCCKSGGGCGCPIFYIPGTCG
jgi:hypothetical protein